jgi:hypothetical protein
MRLERRAEELKNEAKEGTETAQRDPRGRERQFTAATLPMPEAEAVQPWRAEGDGLETSFCEPSERERCTRT